MAFIKSIATLILVLFLSHCGLIKISQQTPFITVNENQFKALYPKSEEFTIDPTKGQILKTQKGTSISIEQNSFSFNSIPVQDKVILTVTEAINNSDFLGVGINLNMDREIFESSGMIKMEAKSNGKEISLDKNITVKMPNHSGKKNDFKIYSYDNNRWNFKGSNQQSNRPFPDDEAFSKTVTVTDFSEGRGYRVNSLLNSYSWWNFDYPHSNIICVKGKVQSNSEKRNYLAVSVVGIEYKGVYRKFVQGDSFEINAPMKTKIKIILYDNNEFLGMSNEFTTWDVPGFNYSIAKNNQCQEIGEIKTQKYNKDFWESKEKIENVLNI